MNELYVELLITLVAIILAVLKGSDWYKTMKQGQHKTAFQAIETAVAGTYETFVRETKKSRMDGVLTNEERAQARDIAKEKAVDLCMDKGLDLARVVGADYIDLLIEKAVTKRKGY